MHFFAQKGQNFAKICSSIFLVPHRYGVISGEEVYIYNMCFSPCGDIHIQFFPINIIMEDSGEQVPPPSSSPSQSYGDY